MSKIALAHHWLTTYRGGEKVLEEFCLLLPNAPILTLVAKRGDIPNSVMDHEIVTSGLQKMPGASRYYKQYFMLHALAFDGLKAPADCELLISSDASMVKGCAVPKSCNQICYCHSPPRYVWDHSADYRNSIPWAARFVFDRTAKTARNFDSRAAAKVNHFIANSRFVAQRIQRFYSRDAVVIYPPVDVGAFNCERRRDDFYLIVSQLVPYKRVDLAVAAFSAMNKRLIVIGDGSERERLERNAGPSITFLGRTSFEIVKDHMERCRAFIYPQIEDFGITAVEAQSAGAPVIAYRKGGALESILEGHTGVFFGEQTANSLSNTVKEFERDENCFTARVCRTNAEKFGRARFRNEIAEFVIRCYPWASKYLNVDG